MWIQKRIQLAAKPRGFHLITREIVSQLAELDKIEIGLAHVFLQHTSASLAINENADADVRRDLESYFSRAVAENEPYYRHTLEGPDDMPAHIKTVILGSSLSIPISDGQLALGIWQGIYLCEHRNRAGNRTIIVTLHGE
ncbi:secondary thiamine-phosphate synthase enzyme YjbQ [Methylomonas sp. BW4-1]|uniref:Secondary thiamine-phosphate synthase enzyme YjbQ n=1 Tax=Methylomonas defluvii TaxID=3045149 RepID=A0ABU4UCG5_9GAMM|nr:MULTISPECIES: secondary thiamine-phosphate synthase enzyme YjbQ [unclassified Methylomonas]MDX8127133.1 secondary thiamine-phosphate synthase enzyme YjbQ [Methylomonas sp. OY6]QBC25676.1 YjbQ family protein [Methylomonas sp. LW13]